MKTVILGIFILMSLSSCAMARSSSGRHGYHNNHYQSKEYFSYKKNEWKRTNVGY